MNEVLAHQAVHWNERFVTQVSGMRSDVLEGDAMLLKKADLTNAYFVWNSLVKEKNAVIPQFTCVYLHVYLAQKRARNFIWPYMKIKTKIETVEPM